MADKATAPKLELRDLTVVYRSRSGDDVHAVDDLSLSIADKHGHGEIIVFLGPSGCGKSSILRCVAGLTTPTKGAVLVDGETVGGVGRDRGMVFQGYTSFAWLTVLENVAYGLRLQGIARRQAEEAAMVYVDAVGLGKSAKLYPKELSGGMKQRVAIARSLINKPKLLLMDEPFGALDPLTRAALQREFSALQKSLGKTVVFVTHDVREAFLLGTRVGLMHAGRLVLLDMPQAFMRSEEPRARAYLETLRLNDEILSALSPGVESQARAGDDG
ncbi:MAG: ABC transporter ATP-binding protein [Acidobacteria bacterium]|nr:ABC transporter ATP-binding protein [Acidobacteriota bacterium]